MKLDRRCGEGVREGESEILFRGVGEGRVAHVTLLHFKRPKKLYIVDL